MPKGSNIRRLAGDPGIEVELRRSARARRITLRVSRRDGRVTLTLPTFVPEREAMDFAASRADWVRGQLAQVVAPHRLGIGDTVPVDGQDHRIEVAQSGRTAQLGDGVLMVPPRARDRIGPAVAAYFKTRARDRLVAASDHYAAQLGRGYGRVSLRDTRSRWGSCSSEGNLMYSWRLAMAPVAVQNYVAAHEVAHLVEMNHSDRFWRVVAGLMPDYQTHRNWLRSHGGALQAIDFGSDS
ncbi:MAG: SprT family zinc-dependent metalloprotease [Pseudomonadota bacterium]